MKSHHRVAIGVATLLLATCGNALATDPDESDRASTATERGEVATTNTEAAGRELRLCDHFCPLSEAPVYVPPSRESHSRRIGGASPEVDVRT